MTPERLARIQEILQKRQPDLAVIMEDIEDPHNIFAVMRTCDAVGIQDVYVINMKTKQNRKYGSGSSSSAAKWLTVHHFEDLDECMEEVKSKYSKVYASYLGEGSESFYELDYTQSIALAFGNERKGISEQMLQYCDGRFIIPQVGMIQSLNISVACAVTLYEAKRQRLEKGMYEGEGRMAEEAQQALIKEWGISKYQK